jgi:hypothetical protein
MSMSETNAKADAARRLGRQFAALREELRERGRRSPWLRAAATVVVAVAGFWGFEHFTAGARPSPAASVHSAPIGEAKTVEFTVQGGKRLNDGLTLLNTHRDFRSPENLTVAVRPAIDVPVGRTVHCKGTVSDYKGQRQLNAAASDVQVK